MKILAVLAESLHLLRREPKIFVPKVLTSLLYTAFILYTAGLGLRITRAMLSEQERAELLGVLPDSGMVLMEFSGSLVFFAVFFLFAYAMDILTYGMYVRIVDDYLSSKPIELTRALREAIERGRTLFPLSIVILVFVSGIFIIYLLLGSAFILSQDPFFSLLALLVLVATLMALALVFFFSIPVAVLENEGVFNAITASARLGFKHKGLVIKINLFFASLILATLLVAVYLNFSGWTGLLAMAAFVFVRLLQSLVYTYINIVNPDLYLHLKMHSSGI
jgi:hypothetical protein